MHTIYILQNNLLYFSSKHLKHILFKIRCHPNEWHPFDFLINSKAQYVTSSLWHAHSKQRHSWEGNTKPFKCLLHVALLVTVFRQQQYLLPCFRYFILKYVFAWRISCQFLFDDPVAREKLSFCQGSCILIPFRYLHLSVEKTPDTSSPGKKLTKCYSFA